MRILLFFAIVLFGISQSCCQNHSGGHIDYDDIDSICIDCWRWDKGQRYHIVSDKHKGYILECCIDGNTDSVSIPVALPSDDIGIINEYVTKVCIFNKNNPPHVKKQAKRILYGIPERMVTNIWESGHCISDTFHLPTIREFEYEMSYEFRKLYSTIISITDRESREMGR